MNELKIFEYNETPMAFENINGQIMLNATQMAKHFSKRPNDYLNRLETIELVEKLENRLNPDKQGLHSSTSETGTSDNQVVTTRYGKPENGGGTWMHEIIALDFAQWLSIDFKLWCLDRIKELMLDGNAPVKEPNEDFDSIQDKLSYHLKEAAIHSDEYERHAKIANLLNEVGVLSNTNYVSASGLKEVPTKIGEPENEEDRVLLEKDIKINFGKHKGEYFNDLPWNYIVWLGNKMNWTTQSKRMERATNVVLGRETEVIKEYKPSPMPIFPMVSNVDTQVSNVDTPNVTTDKELEALFGPIDRKDKPF